MCDFFTDTSCVLLLFITQPTKIPTPNPTTQQVWERFFDSFSLLLLLLLIYDLLSFSLTHTHLVHAFISILIIANIWTLSISHKTPHSLASGTRWTDQTTYPSTIWYNTLSHNWSWANTCTCWTRHTYQKSNSSTSGTRHTDSKANNSSTYWNGESNSQANLPTNWLHDRHTRSRRFSSQSRQSGNCRGSFGGWNESSQGQVGRAVVGVEWRSDRGRIW